MITNKLKNMGLKLTPQRLAILKLLEGNTSHPSAEKIYNELKPLFPSLSLATVYNTLEILVRAGEIQEIMIDVGKRHFDPNIAPHRHFFCHTCGAIYDLEDKSPDLKTPFNIEGHLVEEVKLYYYGICHRCSKGEGSPAC